MKGNEPISDEGYDIEIRYLTDVPLGMPEYEARWYNQIPGKTYRFTVLPRARLAKFAQLTVSVSNTLLRRKG